MNVNDQQYYREALKYPDTIGITSKDSKVTSSFVSAAHAVYTDHYVSSKHRQREAPSTLTTSPRDEYLVARWGWERLTLHVIKVPGELV